MRSKSGHETLRPDQLRRQASDMGASAKRTKMHCLTNRCSGCIVKLGGKRHGGHDGEQCFGDNRQAVREAQRADAHSDQVSQSSFKMSGTFKSKSIV